MPPKGKKKVRAAKAPPVERDPDSDSEFEQDEWEAKAWGLMIEVLERVSGLPEKMSLDKWCFHMRGLLEVQLENGYCRNFDLGGRYMRLRGDTSNPNGLGSGGKGKGGVRGAAVKDVIPDVCIHHRR